ncbi:MAG TPA: hypothetical protein VET46_04440 [Steroidobacteraceae bacterium]|nr:hypothetical protein [Steroidobacteraceae bacterium]
MRLWAARPLGALSALVLFCCASHAATVVQLESDPGDLFGSNTYTQGGSITIAVDVSANSTVTVNVTDTALRFTLNFSFTPRPGVALVGPAHVMPLNPRGTEAPVISATSNMVPCATQGGMFVVYEVVGTPGAITQLALDFEQRCYNATGLTHGQIRFNSSVPLTRPAPLAVIDAPDYADQGDNITLDGTWSLAGTSAVASYSWQQLSGPAVALSDSTAAAPTFVATADAGAVSPLVFGLTTTDGQGNTGTTQYTVNVYSSTTPRTVLAFESDPGEYVFGGRSYKYRDTDTPVSTRSTTGGPDGLQILSGVTVLLQAPGGAALQAGNYLDAIRMSDGFHAGLDVFGFGAGCNDELGQFSIYEISFDTANNLTKLALDFDRRCTSNPDSAARAYGQIRINSTLPLIGSAPHSIAGNPQEVSAQSTVQLDGSSSRPGANPIVSYAWSQVSGPAVVLSSASAVSPSFTAPALATGSVQLVFALTVADAYGNSATSQVTITVVSASVPRNLLKIDSTPDDYIGQGEQETLDENDSGWSVTNTTPSSVSISVISDMDGLGMTFSAPVGQTLHVGNYEGAQNALAAAPVRPGMLIEAPGRACDTIIGRFVIREIAFATSGTLTRFAADALQYCDGGSALNIAVRYQSSIPVTVTAPTAAAGGDQDVLERSAVALDGRNTMPGTGNITSWQWTQVSGPPVTLTNATTSAASFSAPKVAATETLGFQLTVTSDNGGQSTDTANITIHKKTDPRTFASLNSAVGDYIGGGQSYSLTPADGLFFSPSAVQIVNNDAIRLDYNGGPETWSFGMASSGAPLTPGTYAVDTSVGPPEMAVSHIDRGCDVTRGSFTIYDIAYANGVLQRAAFDFTQWCDASTGSLQGQVRFNTALPDANAGGNQSVAGGASLVLDGSASVPAVGSLQKYSWQQISGPAASIANGNTRMATVTAPAVNASATLVFQLTVTDDRGLTDSDRMSLTVNPAAPAPPPSGGGGAGGSGGGGGAISVIELLVGLVCLLCRARPGLLQTVPSTRRAACAPAA